MRIAFVVYGGLHLTSGGFYYDRQLVAALRAHGDTIDVIAIPWHGYPRALLANVARWPFDPARYDLVLEDELVHPAVLWRHRAVRRAGVPLVSLVHNLASQQPGTPARALVAVGERAYLSSIDAVIAACASTRDDVLALVRRALPAAIAYAGRDSFPGEGDPLIGSGIDADAHIETRACAAGPLRLLFVGTVAPHKGLHRLLPVLAALPAAVARLDVAGALTNDAAYVRRIRRQIVDLGLVDRVCLHGELDRPSLSRLYRESHLLTLPSDREAYPLAGLDGLAFGLPLLLTNAGGTSELVGAPDAGSGVSAGQVLSPDDRSGWIAAIAGFTDDRQRLLAASRAALARHRAHGLWADTGATVRAFLADVVARRVRSSG